MDEPGRAYRTVLVDCLGVSAGEDVLVVTDPARRQIAESLLALARDLGAEAVLAEMSARSSNGSEPPRAIASAMLGCDVIVAPTTKSLSHTAARKAASDDGARIATMPGITAEMLERTMSADYDAIRSRSEGVQRILSEGREVRVASAAGTEVVFSIEGRTALADTGDLTSPGSFGNLPAGEGFIAPEEGATSGRIVFDGAVPKYGEPLIVTIEDGYAVSFEGKAGDLFRGEVERHGRDALAVAELGVGTNEAARLTGRVLEDEKILGTIHVAFGDNHTFGGTLRVSSHVDHVVLEPVVSVDGRELLKEGRLAV